MKTPRIILVTACLAVACLAGFANEATAKTLSTSMSPSQLRGICGSAGGTFGTNQQGDGVCLGRKGGAVICTKDKKCMDGAAMVKAPDLPANPLGPAMVSAPDNHSDHSGFRGTDIQPEIMNPSMVTRFAR
jgi:hypothetical protein